tara:strand:- start:194 stop:418 length:225 start_codon:yes stop_codon:yes gene_type:complete
MRKRACKKCAEYTERYKLNNGLCKSCTKQRLEYLREQIKNECISMGEIAELQGLAEHIDEGDVELLEWAGVDEK